MIIVIQSGLAVGYLKSHREAKEKASSRAVYIYEMVVLAVLMRNNL